MGFSDISLYLKVFEVELGGSKAWTCVCPDSFKKCVGSKGKMT